MSEPTKSRILIVDDQAELISLIEDELEDYGFKLFTARSGVEAIDLLKETSVDMLLTDISMPGMLGYELVSSVQYLYPKMKCAYMTAGLLEDIPEDGIARIRKKWNVAILLKFIEGVLGIESI